VALTSTAQNRARLVSITLNGCGNSGIVLRSSSGESEFSVLWSV